MFIIDEAAAMVSAGTELVVWNGDRIAVRRGLSGEFVITRSGNGAPMMRWETRTAKGALRMFRSMTSRQALVAAIEAHRYGFLFPIGSTLDWSTHPPQTMRQAS